MALLAPDQLVTDKRAEARGAVGWELKATATRARRYADAAGLPYIALENGFLRPVGPGGADGPFSIAADESVTAQNLKMQST